MKRKSITNVSQRIMAGCLSVAIILTGIVIVPKTTNAEAATAVYWDKEKTYKMSDYWSTTDKKAPVKAGYVFSGWYDVDQKTPLKQTDLTTANDDAIAKFVPAEVLSIKTQVGTPTDENVTYKSMRILSTVDSTNYQGVGFEYKLATQAEGSAQFTKVYSKIRQSKETEQFYEPDIFVSGVSQYFIAADVSEIQDTSFAKIVYARPYWITMDGTKVMGLARNSRVEDKGWNETNTEYTSVGINLLPMETVKAEDADVAQVAAGKIQVKYNKDYYTVQSVDTIVDNSEGGVGGKYLFPEMECHVDADEGTITFVGNAEIQDGNLTNLAADGLFANVRFVKSTGNTSNTALSYEIVEMATDFCNWAETPVTEFVVQ